MAVIRLTSKKTLPILTKALQKTRFTQTELAKELGISIGRVNKIINWCQERGIIIKEKGKYEIVQPNRLTDLIANEQTIRKKQTFYVAEKPTNLLKNNKACLLTALNLHQNKQPEKELHLIATEETIKELQKMPRGETIIHLYEYESPIEENMTQKKQLQYTDKVRTIIDCKTMGLEGEIKNLIFETWGTWQ